LRFKRQYLGALFAVLFLIYSFFVTSGELPGYAIRKEGSFIQDAVTNESEEKTGIYLPLYSYPTSSQWAEAIKIKQKFPKVPMVTCVNPSNGPGSKLDLKFLSGVENLTDAGIKVGGYVATDYGNKRQADVKNEITKYRDWYDRISGICFDEMQNKKGKENYYSSLTRFSKSAGFNFTIGNPGTDISPGYIGTVDYIKIYEGSGVPKLSFIQGWHLKYDKKNFMTISYNVPILNYTYLMQASKFVGFIYITNDTLPNPYDTIPKYLFDIASFLNSTL
jgi:hypothetical protein